MHGLGSNDKGMKIDWGKTSHDYAQYRQGPPISYYKSLELLGLGKAGQRILDLGTGTGILARQFAQQGALVTASDISAEQVKMAAEIAKTEGLNINFIHAAAEDLDFPESSFDMVTANQCFLYFKKEIMVEKIKKWIGSKGYFLTSHFSWLPLEDAVAGQTELLILKFNPQWSAHGYKGVVPEIPYNLGSDFRVEHKIVYDEMISFTRESWRGRIRASRGIGASLAPDQIKSFDGELEALLKKITNETFAVKHRIDIHVMRAK